MSRRVEKTITHPAYLSHYRELCHRHPWYSEASEMQLAWSEKVAKIRAMPGDFEENIKVLYRDNRPISIEDDIAFAKEILRHTDVLWYFEDQERRIKENPDTQELPPNYVTIIGSFTSWYFFKQGLPYQPGEVMFAAKAIIHKYLRGDLSSIDGPEARAYAMSLGMRKQHSSTEKK